MEANNSLSFALKEIFTIVQQWTKKKSRVSDLEKIFSQYGDIAYSHFIYSLLCGIESTLNLDGSQKLNTLVTTLKEELKRLAPAERLVTILCRAVDEFLYNKSPDALSNVFRNLNLSKDVEILLYLALAHSHKMDISGPSKDALKEKLPRFLTNWLNNPSAWELNTQFLQKLFALLDTSSSDFGVDPSQMESLRSIIQGNNVHNACPLVLRPFVCEESKRKMENGVLMDTIAINSKQEMIDFTLAHLLREVGYAQVSDKCALKVFFSQLNPQRHLSPKAVAQAICMFLQTSSPTPMLSIEHPNSLLHWAMGDNGSLPSTGASSEVDASRPAEQAWDVDNFISVLYECHPELDFKEVIKCLDCSQFEVSSVEALSLLKKCLIRGMKESLPIADIFYKPWQHPRGQFSLIKHTVENVSVWNLDAWEHRTTDLSPALPPATDPETKCWLNLDLIESLLRLGDTDMMQEVTDLLRHFMSHYHSTMVHAFLQTQIKMTALKQKLLNDLFRFFFVKGFQSLLKVVWNAPNNDNKPSFRELTLITVLNEYHSCKGEEARDGIIQKAVELAVELKAIVEFLEVPDIRFDVEFAVLAARFDHVKIETVFHKLYESYGQTFLTLLVDYRKRKVNVFGNFPPNIQDCFYKYINNQGSSVISSQFLPMKPAGPPTAGLSSNQSIDPKFYVKEPSSSSVPHNSNPKGFYVGTGGSFINRGNIAPGMPSIPQSSDNSYSVRGMASDVPQGSMNEETRIVDEIIKVSIKKNGLDEYIQHIARVFSSDPLRGNYVSVFQLLSYIKEIEKLPSNEFERALTIFMHALSQIPRSSCDEALSTLIMNIPYAPNFAGEILVKISRCPLGQFNNTQVIPYVTSHNYFRNLPHNVQESLLSSPIIEEGTESRRRNVENRSAFINSSGVGMMSGNTQAQRGPLPQQMGNSSSQMMLPPAVGMNESGTHYHPSGMSLPSRSNVATSVNQNFPTLSGTRLTPQCLTMSLYQAAQSANQMARQARDETRPSQEVQNSVAFIFNNVCRNNIDSKARELINLVPTESIGWLIKNIVVRRVTSDQNFHELFLHIIDAFNERYNYVHAKATQEIFKIIKHILNNINHSEDDFNNRTILKYLANFLGLLTLAKNRPILCDELNFKALLCEAYYSGTIEMNFVVPFVSRCLEHVKSSMVFKPPNPWTMSHLRVLKELHVDESDYVTSSARFEVEILFSGLSIDIKEVEPTHYLRSRDNFDKLDQRLIGTQYTMVKNLSQQHMAGQQQSITGGGGGGGMSMTAGDMDVVSAAAAHAQMQSTSSMGGGHVNVHPSMSQPHLQMSQAGVSSVSSSKGPVSLSGQPLMSHQGQHSVSGLPMSQYASHHMNAMTESGPIGQQGHGGGLLSANSMTTYVGRFRYCDIKIINLPTTLSNYITLDDSMHLFQNNPELKKVVIQGIIKSFQDILMPILERCKRHIRPTVKSLVRKDFCLDPDPARMQASAQAMTRFLASALAMIHSRDPLCISVSTVYKQTVLQYIPSANAAQKDLVERAASLAATSNIDMLVAHMQKYIAERLVKEFDDELLEEYMLRMKAKFDKVVFSDTGANGQANNILPEKLRKSVKGPSPSEMQVYEDFLNNLPGFQPKSFGYDFQKTIEECSNNQSRQFQSQMTSRVGGLVNPVASSCGAVVSSTFRGTADSAPPPTMPMANNTQVPASGAVGVSGGHGIHPNLYESIFPELERQLTAISSILRTTEPVKTALRNLIDAVHLAMTSSHDNSPQDVLRITINNLMDSYDTRLRGQSKGHEVLERFKEAHLNVIRLMLTAELPPINYSWITNQITSTWKAMEDPSDSTLHTGKWNFDPFTELLKIHVINLNQLDQYLAEEIRKNKIRAIGFALDLFEHYIIGEKREFTVLNEYDIYSTIEMILGLFKNGQVNLSCNETLQKRVLKAADRMREYLDMGLLERYQIPGTSWLYSGCSQSREFDDHTMLTEKTEQLMRRWFEIQASSEQRDPKTFHGFLKEMYEYGILETDESITRFFRLATVLVVERALKVLKSEANSNAGPNSRFASYSELDAYARLLALLIKEAGRNNADQLAKPKLLNKALGIISGVLIQEHEVRPQWFNPMPFHRILNMLFMELSDETTMAGLSRNILTAFCNTLHILRPGRTAAFVFSWLEIISQRVFLAKMLGTNSPDELQYNTPMYAQLIVDLLKYIHTFLNQSHLSNAVMHLYRGSMRWLMTLMRDCPELLSDYHSLFCDYIPPTAFQMRNIILSAVPRDCMASVESHINYTIPTQIAEIADPTGYCMTAGDRIVPASFKQAIDSFVVSRTPVDFLPDLLEKLRAKPSDPYPYNIEMMSNVLLYLCTTTVRTLRDKNLSITYSNISPTSEMVIILSMILSTDSAGRYLLLNVMANQLRYPNSHTFYFMQTFLSLFSEVKEEQIKEQITRVLVERLLVYRPHPWGLLVTMAELMRNPAHKFWDHEFTRCASDIENMLRSVYDNLRG